MKPTTKIQKDIIELSNQLKPLSQKDIDYINSTIHLNYVALSYKQKHVCLECGEKWNESVASTRKNTTVICPNCEKALVEYNNYSKGATVMSYACKIDKIKDYQVVRMFACYKFLNKEKKANYNVVEVFQDFINDKGVVKRLSLSTTNSFSMYFDNWDLSSELEFRSNSSKEVLRSNLEPSLILPSIKTIKAVRRNGFKRSFHNINPRDLFIGLLSSPYVETLFKAKRYNLIKAHIYQGLSLTRYWKPIKITLRNNYQIKDVSLWKDYIDLLADFDKDLSNSKYVCPEEEQLINEHDKYLKKKTKLIDAERIERERLRKAEALKHKDKVINSQSEENVQYIKEMQKFFDLSFKEKNITIQPLKTIEQFYNEGKILNHCVFTNNYYKKNNRLILSAKVNDQVTETIEISLDRFNILQARGSNNQPSKYHSKIVKLVNENMYQIQNIA